MLRDYHKWYSPHLKRDMELLVFGHAGAKVLFFPPRMGRFYDYENWRVIKALEHKINAGQIQLFCVDSIDLETFYCNWAHPGHKIYRHHQYEQYILNEVFPLMHLVNSNPNVISAGCSLGAYHAVNIAMKHPYLFCKVVGMSGRYDLTVSKGCFNDLLDGYHDEYVYYNMPNQYLKNLNNSSYISAINNMDVVLAIGKEDTFLYSNHKLKSILDEKGISYQYYEWNEEAHRARYWRQMVKLYI
ncbi:alpha/beta hydrolase-fold protein [Flavobacteriaceae bacterium]|nr:alpha/beta hydrolase-fold protein [Flavobacteriaceae bacterium]